MRQRDALSLHPHVAATADALQPPLPPRDLRCAHLHLNVSVIRSLLPLINFPPPSHCTSPLQSAPSAAPSAAAAMAFHLDLEFAKDSAVWKEMLQSDRQQQAD